MKKKSSLIILISLLIVILVGIFSVISNRPAFENTLVAIGIKEAPILQANADPYIQELLEAIPVSKIVPKKKNASRIIWQVGRGISYPNYLLRAQKHLESHGGKVLSMEEIHANRASKVLLDFVAPFGDTFHIEMQMADTFYDNTSRLAVAFYTNSKLKLFSSHLNQLKYPYSLLITPSEMPELKNELEKLNGYESVIWLPMESKQKIQKYKPIYIHHSENDIRTMLQDAMEQIPNAIGVATRFGDRAVEQQALLHAIFRPLKELRLWFMDLTNNRYSKTQEVCDEISLKCRLEKPFNPNQTNYSDYIKSVLRMAQRSGKAILMLPLCAETFKAIENLEADAMEQGSEFISLSHIFQKE